MFAAKTVFTLAVVAATVWWTPDSQNVVLTGATVFYATTLYLNNRFEYPAVYASETDIVGIQRDDRMGDVFAFPTITNLGDNSAENLTVQMRIVDPSRNCSTRWFDATTSLLEDVDADAPLDVRRTRNMQIGFDSSKHTLGVRKMDGRFGDDSWVEIEIDSPDQLTSTRVYKRLNINEFNDPEEVRESMKIITEIFGTEAENPSSS